MRHRVSGTKFSVSYDHRRMLLRNLLTSLVLSGQITTTESKAKTLKSTFDKFITKVKKGDLASRRYAKQTLLTGEAYELLYKEVLPSIESRTSGYTTLKRHDISRVGDGAKQVTIEVIKDK
jgi:large subunit ribosomal protein L17